MTQIQCRQHYSNQWNLLFDQLTSSHQSQVQFSKRHGVYCFVCILPTVQLNLTCMWSIRCNHHRVDPSPSSSTLASGQFSRDTSTLDSDVIQHRRHTTKSRCYWLTACHATPRRPTDRKRIDNGVNMHRQIYVVLWLMIIGSDWWRCCWWWSIQPSRRRHWNAIIGLLVLLIPLSLLQSLYTVVSCRVVLI